MGETFGRRLKRFALSVDIVDDYIFRQAWDLVRQYIVGQLNPSYWALLVDSEVDNKPGLLARECSEGHKPSFSLRTEEGRYTGLAAYSFCEGKPLWLVSPDKGPLDPTKPVQDEWSKAENLPHFDRSPDAGIKTMVLVPLRQKGHTIGVLDLQSTQHNELTIRITTELVLLAETLSVLLTLSETNTAQHDHTLEVINLHSVALNEESWPLLTKPRIFVASSGRADDAVMGAIRSVLDEFSDQLDVHYWKESSASGNINWEILKEVKESQFGLCYFSEPTGDPNGKYRYQDNMNVVFEAGMFQSQTNPTVTDQPVGWIPIREQEPLSPPPPFDFAQQRMIIVERLADERKPNIDKLRASLKDRIGGLLG
jgi:hypothetical protein